MKELVYEESTETKFFVFSVISCVTV
jgi:hypothetical protein